MKMCARREYLPDELYIVKSYLDQPTFCQQKLGPKPRKFAVRVVSDIKNVQKMFVQKRRPYTKTAQRYNKWNYESTEDAIISVGQKTGESPTIRSAYSVTQLELRKFPLLGVSYFPWKER